MFVVIEFARVHGMSEEELAVASIPFRFLVVFPSRAAKPSISPGSMNWCQTSLGRVKHCSSVAYYKSFYRPNTESIDFHVIP